ncbi:Wd Repeat-Containing Protein 82 [Manis pentadactyla]|nr:Wd Repeat-Containing Protein 82 [Manis pentadactyla]
MVDTSCSSPLCPVLPYKSIWTQAGQALLRAAILSQRTNCFEGQGKDTLQGLPVDLLGHRQAPGDRRWLAGPLEKPVRLWPQRQGPYPRDHQLALKNGKEVRGLTARGNMTLPQRFMAQEA